MPVDLTVGPPPRPETNAASDPAGVAPEPGLFEVDEPPLVEEATVKSLLRGIGAAAHTVFADDDVVDHWRFTAREIDDLGPPLTRIVNRRPKLRAAVARGDEAAVVLVLAGYAGRNVEAGKRAKEARGDVDEPRQADGAAGDDRTATGGTHPGAPGDAGGRGGVHPAAGGGVR